MKHSLFIAFFLCLGSFASAQQLTSPDGNLSLEFMEQADGVPAYRLDYKGKPVLTSGRLGLLTEEADLIIISHQAIRCQICLDAETAARNLRFA